MSHARLREELSRHVAPGEVAAGQRSWRVVEAAHAQRGRTFRRAQRGWRLAAAAAVAALCLAGALTPAGAAVRDWISEAVGVRGQAERPMLSRLPADGRLLVSGPSGTWIVERDGGLRRLGAFSSASWSPRGLYALGAKGRRLTAVDARGEVRWSRVAPGRVSRPAWSSGDGFRVAYLAAGSLRVAAGDGSGDHRLGPASVAAVTPAWRPGPGHVLSVAGRRGEIVTLDADRGRRLWAARGRAAPLALAWTPDGRRLLALSNGRLSQFSREGRLRRTLRLPGAASMAVHPGGERVAVSARGSEGSRVLSISLGPSPRPRRLFAGQGGFSDLEWSPDGRWLLVAWREADQWILLGRRRTRRLIAYSRISSQFDPAGTGSRSFPRVAGWCCVR